ncbi:MAG: hypothetical protein IJV38_12395 [Prevotella sp.]|nr:hypothetical protein [Prevotella sp.]
MKKFFFSLLTLLAAASSAEAKYWKIGPSSVTGMDFASINAAMGSSSVSAGDTLYLDQYYNESAEQNVTKRVVIIGTGYDTSLTDEQVVAVLTGNLNLKANKAEVKSTKLSTVNFYNTDCILDRCYTNEIKAASSTAGINHIYSCYILGSIVGYSSSQYSLFDIQNNCISKRYANQFLIRYLTSSFIKNNVIIASYYSGYTCLSDVNNTEITNNIILSINSDSGYNGDLNSNVYSSGSGNSIEHNILSHTGALTYYPNNKTGFGASSSELFSQTGNFSDYYKLADSSPAIGYATDGGEVGCHGGMFGCPSGGRPQYIPYFTKVTIGSRSENAKLPVSVSIKIQDE